MVLCSKRFAKKFFFLAYILFSIWFVCQIKKHININVATVHADEAEVTEKPEGSKVSDVNSQPNDKAPPELETVYSAMEAHIGIVMFGCNRTVYMDKSLTELIDIRSKTQKKFAEQYGTSKRFTEKNLILPIIMSMDCHHQPTLDKLQSFSQGLDGISKIYDFAEIEDHIRQNHHAVPIHLRAYYRLSRNYYLAFKNIFNDFPKLQQLIVVEDDLSYSEDFLDYFITLAPLLRDSREIFCVSAWNDNAKTLLLNTTADSSTLRHTDFFPGLGWMLNRQLWKDELETVWPSAFWDDWIRARMNGRTCIQPMVSRTETFGRKGASHGQFFDAHLKKIKVTDHPIAFYGQINQLNHDLSPAVFNRRHLDKVYTEATQIDAAKFYHHANNGLLSETEAFTIVYYTNYQFKAYTAKFELMTDLKWGVPRSAYKGIISFRYKGYPAFLAPPPTRKIYIKSWD